MGYEDLKGLIICSESPEEIAQKIIDLLNSEALAQEHGELAQISVMENYCWEVIIEQVIAAYSFAYKSVHSEKKNINEVPPSLFFEENRHSDEAFHQHVCVEKESAILI